MATHLVSNSRCIFLLVYWMAMHKLSCEYNEIRSRASQMCRHVCMCVRIYICVALIGLDCLTTDSWYCVALEVTHAHTSTLSYSHTVMQCWCQQVNDTLPLSPL